MDVEYLADRDSVIQATIALIEGSHSEVEGMGRQIAWIGDKSFRAALTSARQKRNVTVRVIGVDEGDVRHFARQFEGLGATVKFYDHGDVRVALADGKAAVLAFPLPCVGVSGGTDRSYVGLKIRDEAFCQWLKARFDEIWEHGVMPSRSFWIGLWNDFRQKPALAVATIVAALLGALMTGLVTWLLRGGSITR